MSQRCPNTFNHPNWIRAISAHIPGALHVKVPPTGATRLSAVLMQKSWPLRHADSWVTSLSNSGLPAAGLEPTPVDALAMLDATETPIFFRNLPVDHPVTEALLQAAAQSQVLNRWQRAGLELNKSFDGWLQNNFDQKRRKELKRLRSRLAEKGKLESISLPKNGDLSSFLQAFLTLEADSWKGNRGTAIASKANEAKALEAGLLAMHQLDKLKFWQINLDDKPIASLFAIHDDGEVTLGKIAHADEFAKYSPGVLIVLDSTADLLADSTLMRADSNAIPGHPMIDRIWRDRIECIDVLLAGPSTPTTVFNILAKWIGMKSAFRSVMKRVLARTTGRRIS
jgi:CelD/BcsL family acetyltransferase involved in cellulose biosynthesis